MSRVVQWKVGSKMTGDATPVYNELEDLRRRDGCITPQAVVERARRKSSAMHRHFDWDDTSAAGKYRLEQARKLTRSIEIVPLPSSPQHPVSAYSVVTVAAQDDQPPARVYESTEEAMLDPIKRDEILGRAIREAVAFRRKYAALQELAKVMAAIDAALASIEVGG